jgi:hypothetical protein
MVTAEEAVLRAVRAQRVEARGLDQCVMCGGTTEATEDVTLHCDCEERAARLRARAARLAHEHRRGDDGNASDRIAP